MKTLVFRLCWVLGMNFFGLAALLAADEKDCPTPQAPSNCFCRAPDSLKNAPGYAEALKYAPILWFADEEQYFPTLPFFSAFDSVDNDHDGKWDFDDQDEIAPLDSASKKFSHAAWDSLRRWYEALKSEAKRRMTTVFYRKRTTTAAKVRSIFFNDEQFWRRLEKKVKANPEFKKYLASRSEIPVYEYYFYFVNDEGLLGHPHDMERVFVFIADDSPVPFRIVVGDGHGDGTPNNVLIYKMNNGPDSSYRYENHLHILVELGGHSIAPDLKGDGRFDPVVDANWHHENAWGTRDVQAKVGGGATGDYETWMTFQRDPLKKVFPPDSTLGLPASHFCYRLLPADNFKNLYHLLSKAPRASAFLNRSQSYQPSDLLSFARQLDNKMTRNQERKSPEKYIEDEFNFLNDVAFGYNPSNSVAKLSAFRGVSPPTLWTKDLIWDLSKTGIPRHRPYGFALWNDLEKNSYPVWKLGVLFDPKISSGVLELQVGTTVSKLTEQNPEISALYDWRYGKTLSAFGKISWRHNRPAASDVTLGLGVSFVPPFYISQIRPHDFFRHFRVRGGINMGLANSARLRFKPELQIGLYEVPIAFPSPYSKLNSRRHKVWEHPSYKDEPVALFKPHLFRPRRFRGLGVGVWGRMELEQKARPELRLSVILPAWDFVPVKLDGILEIQAWWKDPNFQKLSPRKVMNDFERQRWTLAVYYDRFYASKVSWYANVAWINNLTEDSRYSLGGGVSITPGPLFRLPLVQKLRLHHWLKIRFGFRSDFDRKTGQLNRHRLELQTGLHY